ncbi:MAG TPA: M28 family peptidase [bacterium]
MDAGSPSGWARLVGAGAFAGEGSYPIPAYSEFMPAVRLGVKPYRNAVDPLFFSRDDPHGWPISEREEHLELRPGMASIAAQVLRALRQLVRGERTHGLAGRMLAGNPYWPSDLAAGLQATRPATHVVILPLALSRTQDEMGRVRWTLFGGSEHGPALPFWKSFFVAPGREAPAEDALGFFRELLLTAYGESVDSWDELRRAGFRLLSPEGSGTSLPGWAAPLVWQPGMSLAGVRFLLAFQPFSELPGPVRESYLRGVLQLLPFPGSLLFWGDPGSRALRKELPSAGQIPLLHSVRRHEAWHGIRVPQSGWFHEPRPGRQVPRGDLGPLRETFRRTHRHARVHRHEDALEIGAREERVVHGLFSTRPEDLGLYGKPMARNSQIWCEEHRLVLDGPSAGRPEIEAAVRRIKEGGHFGYRFFYPPMTVGSHQVVWHRPLVACLSPDGGASVLDGAPAGWLTATGGGDGRDLELWPRLLDRPGYRDAVSLFKDGVHEHKTLCRSLSLLEARELLGGRRLSRPFARRLVNLPRGRDLENWIRDVSQARAAADTGGRLAELLAGCVDPETTGQARTRRTEPAGLTYRRTARRSFEESYWRRIAFLAGGRYVNKANADCVRDATTLARLRHHHRDLEALGDHLLAYYRAVAARQGLRRRVIVGEMPFRWHTDFAFDWWGGWLANQHGLTEERNLVVVIPGRDRSRAVIMSDHYDTAYMEDVYAEGAGGGARLAAAGADDNHSATAALMGAAPVLMELSREGRLGCDVWLIHLTGEEFPSDCMGARHLCQRLVDGTLQVRSADGRWHDLSGVAIDGVFVLDMVAHNNPAEPDVFQISPGTGGRAVQLACQTHEAAEAWNAAAASWNRRPGRRGRPRGRRGATETAVPPLAPHPILDGQVRLPHDPHSTLYNTDGQIFSDAGIPVVLIMENYDISRQGYHDTHDTMANIDLDYGAAVAAVAIEAVARVAGTSPNRRVELVRG